MKKHAQNHTAVTLVMIEDDEGHAQLVKKNLRRASVGNPVVHLTDGMQAIDYFFSQGNSNLDPDHTVVILDLNLPKIDGYEVLRHLKSEERTKEIPVIVLTTSDNPTDIDRCYQLGCDIHFTKPVEYSRFSDAIRTLGLQLDIKKEQ